MPAAIPPAVRLPAPARRALLQSTRVAGRLRHQAPLPWLRPAPAHHEWRPDHAAQTDRAIAAPRPVPYRVSPSRLPLTPPVRKLRRASSLPPHAAPEWGRLPQAERQGARPIPAPRRRSPCGPRRRAGNAAPPPFRFSGFPRIGVWQHPSATSRAHPWGWGVPGAAGRPLGLRAHNPPPWLRRRVLPR